MTKPIDELLEWLHTFDNLNFSCNHRNVIEKIWQITSEREFAIDNVVNWLPFEEKNYPKFTELCKKDQCICLFDDGTECNYNDKHPVAMMTHFRQA